MNRAKEYQLAKAPYNWLKASPLLTITTLLFVIQMDIGYTLCVETGLACGYETTNAVSYAIGVLASGLWHLLLLQYVNNKESELVRRHGQKALTQAGIRTGVALGAVLLEWLSGNGGGFIFIAVIVLSLIWLVNNTQSKEWVEKDIKLEPETESALLNFVPSTKTVGEPINTEMPAMSDPRKPEEILNEIYQDLQSEDDAIIRKAIANLNNTAYSSEAIRRRLEQLAVNSSSSEVREEAFAALNLSANRAVQKHFIANKLDRGIRHTLLQEINDWERSHLIAKQNAEVIRRRYDFDFTPQAASKPVAAQAAVPTPKAETPAPVVEPKPQVPPEPRPSLLQTLTSEASIKIYLYLGAFFVIAAAAILGAVVPELRLPILLIGTFIFGGLSVAIKKRLPQPSFALFIVFSFLLPITANSLEETLRSTLNLTRAFSDGYWAAILLLMSAIWFGGTWLYESRFFSITAFGALVIAFLRLGDLFDAEPAVYTLLTGIAALLGLAATHLVKKWRDEKFAFPLFLAAQFTQAVNLAVSFIAFGSATFDPSSEPLWNLVTFATWVLATIFFGLSNALYPFLIFPWFAAASLVPMPWFIAAAFDLESLGSSLILMGWGILFTIASEVTRRIARTEKYSLPVLLASLCNLALAVFVGFVHETWLGLSLALVSAVLLAVLHILHSRWWLWTLALLNAIVGYFAFFQLDSIRPLDIFIGYQIVLIGILFLLPDLFLKKDWNANPAWRLPLRIFGAIFIGYLSLILLVQNESGHTAVCYFILTAFVAVYALAYRNAYLAYLPAACLPLGIVFALDAFNLDLWLPALSALAILYFLAGVLLRGIEKWGGMLRTSALVLGTSLSFAALLLSKETGGWYALVMGALFIAEMYLGKNGWLELGAPALFTLGTFLILQDFNVTRISTHLLAYSLIWILADMLAHLTFVNPRPLSMVVRILGGVIAALNYLYLFADSDPIISSIGFAVYALLSLAVSLVYRQANLFYAFTLTLPLFVAFFFRIFDVTKWIHPVIVVAMIYYAAGTFLRAMNRAKDWDMSLLYSGLGVGTFAAFAAPVLGGLDASIPAAAAATLWAFEAFSKRNAWLAFPANGLYLLAYFIILFELNVDEPQFFSIGTALFGLIQHYLLTRAESKTGTFLMGMFSQFVLLGTTYIEMINKNDLNYFFLLFIQSLVVLVYGIIIRSRSLTFFPIGFVALGVVTVVYSALKDIGTIFVIGCTGILLLTLGVIAVLLRERIAKLGEKLSDWQA